MNVPSDRRYTRDHEWAQLEDGRLRMGITDYAQDALGDIVFVQLPEVGAGFAGGAPLGEVDSTKSVSELYAPLAGTVVEVNTQLSESPQRPNDDPYGEGWICVLEPSDPGAYGNLLDPESYSRLVEE